MELVLQREMRQDSFNAASIVASKAHGTRRQPYYYADIDLANWSIATVRRFMQLRTIKPTD